MKCRKPTLHDLWRARFRRAVPRCLSRHGAVTSVGILFSGFSYLVLFRFWTLVNISVAGSSIAAEYHLSQIQLGWVFSSFLWGYALFQTLGGWLADRLGPRRVLTAGVVWWGIFTALTAAVSPAMAGAVFLFVLVRFLLGAGEAIIFPASNQFISRWIPTQERGIANGVIFAGVGAGAGSGSGHRYVHHGSLRLALVFLAERAHRLARGAGLVPRCARHTRNSPKRSPSRTATHSNGPWRGRRAAMPARCPPSSLERYSHEPGVWLATLRYLCFGYVAWIFFSWFYIYLAKVRGLDLKASAFYIRFLRWLWWRAACWAA